MKLSQRNDSLRFLFTSREFEYSHRKKSANGYYHLQKIRDLQIAFVSIRQSFHPIKNCRSSLQSMLILLSLFLLQQQFLPQLPQPALPFLHPVHT